MLLGRVRKPGEPEWLPEDLDVVDLILDQEKHHHGDHYEWQFDDLEGFVPGYRVCPLCEVMEPYKNQIRKQNADRGLDEHGLIFSWYPPREEDDDGD